MCPYAETFPAETKGDVKPTLPFGALLLEVELIDVPRIPERKTRLTPFVQRLEVGVKDKFDRVKGMSFTEISEPRKPRAGASGCR